MSLKLLKVDLGKAESKCVTIDFRGKGKFYGGYVW